MIIELSQARQWRADLARHGRNPALVARGKVLLDRLPTIGEDVKQAKNCAYVLCGEPFIAERKDQIYCPKGTCKMAAHRMRYHNESTDLADILARARDAELQWHGVAGQDATAKQRRDDTLRAAYDAIARDLGIVRVEMSPFETHVEMVPVELHAKMYPIETHVEMVPVELHAPVVVAPVEPLTPEIVRGKLLSFMAETSFGQGKIGKLAGVSQSTISKFLSRDDEKKTDGSEDFRRAILDLVTQDHGLDRR